MNQNLDEINTLVSPVVSYCRIYEDYQSKNFIRVNETNTTVSTIKNTKPFHFKYVFQDDSNLNTTLTVNALEYLLDGYNVSVFKYGYVPRSVGKSNFVEFTTSLLNALFERISCTEGWKVGLSAWDMANDCLQDLLAPPSATQSESIQNLITFHVNSLDSALGVFARAHAMKNKTNYETKYFFTRVVIYNTTLKQVSSMHIVSLAGEVGSIEAQSGTSSLQNVVDNVLSSNASESNIVENSAIHRVLAPLLSGNSKSFFIMHLAGAECVKTLELGETIQLLQCVCTRIPDVSFFELGMIEQPNHSLGSDGLLDLSDDWLGSYLMKRRQLTAQCNLNEKESIHRLDIEQKVKQVNLQEITMDPGYHQKLESNAAFIDVDVADNLLRKNYNVLLEVLQDQNNDYKQLQKDFEDYKLEALEKYTTNDVKIDTLKLQNIALKSRIRKQESGSFAKEYFIQCEHDIQSLEREVDQLRVANVALELQSEKKGTPPIKRFLKLSQKFENLCSELSVLKKRNRKFLLNEKLVQSSSKKLFLLNEKVNLLSHELLKTRLGEIELAAQIHNKKDERNQITEHFDELKKQHEGTVEELIALKMYLSTMAHTQKSPLTPIYQRPLDSSRAIKRIMDDVMTKAKVVAPNLVHSLEKLRSEIKLQNLREERYIEVLNQLITESPSSLSLRDELHAELATLY